MNAKPQVLAVSFEPIGFIRTRMRNKFETPRQPVNSREEAGVIELLPDRGFERALQDLAGFERIWLLWWFHKNSKWRPLVRPPRGDGTRRGVFATRSPHRPNPIGLTAVPLLEVSGLRLVVGNSDLLDGTPILDIKPYIGAVDAFPEARDGWLAEVEGDAQPPPDYTVEFAPLAAEQLEWLRREWAVDFITRAAEVLKTDPRPHRTRRISRYSGGRFRIACGPWRVVFSRLDDGRRVLIECVQQGYPSRRLLADDGYTGLPDREALTAFSRRWPQRLPGE